MAIDQIFSGLVSWVGWVVITFFRKAVIRTCGGGEKR